MRHRHHCKFHLGYVRALWELLLLLPLLFPSTAHVQFTMTSFRMGEWLAGHSWTRWLSGLVLHSTASCLGSRPFAEKPMWPHKLNKCIHGMTSWKTWLWETYNHMIYICNTFACTCNYTWHRTCQDMGPRMDHTRIPHMHASDNCRLL